MREKRTNHPLGRRTLAALLAICMLLTMTPAVAAEVETRTLTGFTALSDEVREQTVPHGTAREDLTLPDTLEATALIPAPAEIIEDAEPPLADVPAAETVLVTGVTWESAPAYDGAISGTYVFAPVLPAAYVPAAGVSLPVITVTVAQTEPSAADHVIAMIDALPAMEQWMAMEEAAARAAMDEILAAKAAYDGLTAVEQAQMDEARTAKLAALAELAEQLADIMPMADIASGTTGTCNWVIDADGTLTISPKSGANGVLENYSTSNSIPWYTNRTSVKKVVIAPGVKTAESALQLFGYLSECIEMDLQNLDTSAATDMGAMFIYCEKLETLTLGSGFSTAKVTNMMSMFLSCSSLTTLNLSMFDTSNVESMNTMFANCHMLETLTLGSGFSTAKVTDMTHMFSRNHALKSLDVSGFNTAEVTTMEMMFLLCGSLTELDVSKFNTAKVANMSQMFNGCSSLTALDLSGFSFAGISSSNASAMFGGCNLGLKVNAAKYDMFSSATKIYLYGKYSRAGFGEDYINVDSDAKNLVYKPYAITKSAAGGTITTSSKFTAEDYENYFTKTAGFYSEEPAPTYDSAKDYAQQGETVTVTVTPDEGYTVKNVWLAGTAGLPPPLTPNGNKYTFTMPVSNLMVMAQFELPGYDVTINPKRDGEPWNVQITFSLENISTGAHINDLTAVPNGTYKILETVFVSGVGEIQEDTGVTVTVNGGATSATLEYYTVTLTAGEGIASVTNKKTYRKGKTATITATAAEGYTFAQWSDGDANATREIKVNAKTELTATATANGYPVTLSIQKDREQWTDHGRSFALSSNDTDFITDLTLVPNGTYTVYEVRGEVKVSTGVSVKVNGTESTAYLKYYTLHIDKTPGIATVSGEGVYLEGESVALTAAVEEGYVFREWRKIDGFSSVFVESPFTVDATAFLTAAALPESPAGQRYTVTMNGAGQDYDNFMDAWDAAIGAGNTAGATVQLHSDVTYANHFVVTDGPIIVPAGKTVTLDLNGHTIDRGLTEARFDGNVITVVSDKGADCGTLILDDTSEGRQGKITGGYSESAGGGISVAGNFVMLNGTITGNAAYMGGGVAVGTGTTELKGGAITGNRACKAEGAPMCFGGGLHISVQEAMMFNLPLPTVKLSGGITITGNTDADNKPSNVLLELFPRDSVGAGTPAADTGCVLTVVGELTGKIGVWIMKFGAGEGGLSAASAMGTVAVADAAYNSGTLKAADIACFESDSTAFAARAAGDSKSVLLMDADAAAVADAKAAAAEATYSTTQAATADENAANAYVLDIATKAVNNSTVTVAVNKGSYTAPIAGTLADPDGTDGSYVFTVTVSKGTPSETTRQLTLTITSTELARYAVTIGVKKDDQAWTDHGKTFRLSTDDGATFITDLSKVPNGTYTVYESSGNRPTKTSLVVTVSGANVNVPLNYYTVTVTAGFGTHGANGGGVYCEQSVIQIYANVRDRFTWEKWSDGVTERIRQITVTGALSLTATATRDTPIPTAEGTNIFANGTAIHIAAGTTPGFANVLYDVNGDGDIGDAEYLQIGDNPATDGGYDLSGFTIYGGKNNEALTGDTNITMTGGKVSWIYGGGFGANGTVDGDRTVTVGGTAVIGGAENQGVVIGRGTSWDDNTYVGVKDVTVQSGFTGKVYVVLPTDFDLIANGGFCIANGVTQDMLDNKHIVLTGPGSTVPGVEQRLNGGSFYVEPPELHATLQPYDPYIFANGHPITIKAVGTAGKANVYFDHYRPEQPVTFSSVVPGNTVDGYDMTDCTIYGGSLDKDITRDTHITLEGGSVSAIYGGSRSYDKNTTLTGDTNVTIKGGTAEVVYGGGGNIAKTNTVTGTCHVTVEGGEVGTLYGGSNAVAAVDVRLTGGMTGTVYATSGSTTVNGSPTISITGEAVVYKVYAGGGNNSTFGGTATLTVGGNVQIGAEMENEGVPYGAGISLNPNGYAKGVASFAISEPLTGKVYGLLPRGYDASTRPVIATNATAADLEHFALTSSTVSDLGVKAAYLDGTDIKVKGGVTVTLNYQGADGNNTTATMPVYHGEAYGSLPAPSKSGFGFTGWYDAAAGGNLVTKDTVLASGTIDHTLYAQWGLTDPTVTLAADKTTADYTGSTAITLTATAGHSAQDATFAYEWYKGGVKLDGKTASTLELQNVTDSGSYTVKVQAASGGMTSAWVESSAVTATIHKATPTVSTVPTAGAITYGQALSDSALSGGTASTTGSYAWTDTAAKPACADSGKTEYGVTFTPTDTANYNTATCAVKLTVNKATLTVSVTANNKTYDGTTAATGTISLTGGVNGEVPTATGSFSFADGEAGDSKPVTVVITLDRDWGDNYALNANTTNTTANIAPRSLGNGTAVPADGITVDAIAPQPYQGGAEVKPLPVVKADGKGIDGGNYTLSYTANTAPGTATVTITGKTNYTGSVTATFTIVLGTAPENSFTKPDGLDKWGKTPIVVTGNAGYTVSTAYDSGFGSDVTLSTEGTQTVTIYVKETDTGTVTQAEISYKLDTTAPAVGTVTGNPSGWVTSAVIEFTPSDATSGVASVTVTCDDGKSVTHDNDGFTADRNGTYTITVTDQAGNTATETVTVSKVDGTKPTVSITPTPDSGKWYGATEFVVTSGDGDGGSGVASVTVSGGKFTNADILAAGKFTAEESAAGSYIYTVTVKDAAGNETKAIVTIQLDPKIDEFVAKVGTVNSGSSYEDLRTVQKWYEDQSKIVQSHITNSTAGKAALDQLNGWLDGKTTEAAQAVVDAINGADTIAKIEQAQKDYNALTDAGKAKVTNKDKLDTLMEDAAAAKNVVEQLKNADKPGASYEEKKSALESYDKLTDTQKTLADKDAATQKANVAADLSALQAALDKLALVVKPYTPATKALIVDAKSAYDALDADCKTAFPKDKKAALDALETMRAHAQAVEDKITAMGDSPADADVQAAQAAYNALTADEKLLVDGAKKTALDEAYQAMLGKLDADSKAAAEFATKVAEVKSAPTVEGIQELEQAYGKLTPGAKDKVDADSPTKTDYDKLVADKNAAQPVIDKLSAIDISKLTPENKGAVDATLGDYNGLTSYQKALVDNATGGKAGILSGANTELTDVTTKIDNIFSHDSGTIADGCPSQSDAGSPTGTDHSYNQHKKSIEDAKLAYERLSDPARKLVPQALKDKLNREYDALISYLDYVNTAATVKSKVEVAGLAENVKLPDESVGAGKTIVTVVMEDTQPTIMPPKPAEKSEALSVDVKLVASIYHGAGDATPATTETVQPKDGQPVLVKLLLPTGYALDTLEIWHVKESGSRSRIYDFWLVTEGGGTYAVFEVSSFSHFVFFAEKVKEPDVPTPPTPDNPGTGTGGGSASFQPEISKSEHGTVTVSPERAKPGDKVTITAKPDEGYAVDTVIVKDSGGKTVAVTPGKDGTYTFTQPSGQVTVTVTFKPMEQKPTELPFTDVAQSDWFRDSVAYVYGQGLMNGTSGTTFSPYLSTDRGMIVTILWRMEGSPTATKAATFTDVAPGRYYSEAVAWGAEQGIILGYDDRRYAPGDPITREQLASILWRYARYKKWDVSVGESTNILSYLDFPQISEYAIPALQWAVGAGIITGKGGGILDPKGEAERCQVATILHRFSKDIAK